MEYIQLGLCSPIISRVEILPTEISALEAWNFNTFVKRFNRCPMTDQMAVAYGQPAATAIAGIIDRYSPLDRSAALTCKAAASSLF